MLKHDPQYTRLPGVRGKAFLGGITTYWFGSDHFLVVRVENYTERYQRFAYRDIQAIMMVHNLRRTILTAMILVLLLLCVLTEIFGSTEARLGALAPLVLLGVALLVNHLMGPTCTCHLQTAVQSDKLPGLNRVRAARRMIDRLKARIDQAQTAPANPVT